jgi:predicted ATP-grasp superfamily ATP-dependent carboligase
MISKKINNFNKGVIVLGAHVQALGIVRIFGRLNYSVIVLDNTIFNLAKYSKYCNGFYKIQDSELLESILNFKSLNLFSNYIIFPTNDFHVELLSKNKKLLEPFFYVAIDNWKRVSIFHNKINAYNLARELNVPFPKSYFPLKIQDIDKIEIDFPCIIKPAIMHSFFAETRKKVFICRDRESLMKNYMSAIQIIPQNEIIIQEIIPGKSENQFSAAFLFLNGKSYVNLVATRMRQHPIDFGNATTYAETVHIPLLLEYGEKILLASNYNGICEVEFKMDERDKEYKFLEVNTRTWKWHSISNKAKTPFLELFAKHLTGEQINESKGYEDAAFMHYITDFPTRIKLFIRNEKFWNRKLKNCENAIFARDDFKPWIVEKIFLPYFIFKR